MCMVIMSGVLALVAQAADYQLVDLGPQAFAGAVSAEGTVVGSRQVPEQQAAILAPAPGQVLGTLPGGTMSRANGVSGGEVVGYTTLGQNALQTHTFTWNAQQGMRDLGTMGDYRLFSAATALNQTLTTVGYGDNPTQTAIRPLIWVGTHSQDLGTLGGAAGGASAMNAQGDIVGDSQTAAGDYHATFWPIEGGVVDLAPQQGKNSFAFAINNQRVIVWVRRFLRRASMPSGGHL